MNEVGLVIEVMLLSSSIYPAPDARPAVTEGQWLQRALDLYGRYRRAGRRG